MKIERRGSCGDFGFYTFISTMWVETRRVTLPVSNHELAHLIMVSEQQRATVHRIGWQAAISLAAREARALQRALRKAASEAQADEWRRDEDQLNRRKNNMRKK